MLAQRAGEQAAAMDLCYASLMGWRGTGKPRQRGGRAGQERRWTVDGADCVGGWGRHSRTAIGGAPGDAHLTRVRVRKLACAAPPGAGT